MKIPNVKPDWETGIYIGKGVIVTPKADDESSFWESYVEKFFLTLKENDSELYQKVRNQFKAGRGNEVRDILWEVMKKWKED